ncbi:DUF4349 domain-containing protein [Chloroflexota bacterium]
MKKLIIGLSLVLLLVVPVAACAGAPESKVAPMPEPAPAPRPALAPMPPSEMVQGDRGLPSAADERMIVRNGDMSLVVKDVIKSRDEIAQIAIRLGGFVVSSYISGEEQDRRGSVSIRVPDEKFEQALAEFRGLAIRVTSESTSSQDVTEEYIDLQARLNNAEATESQYLTLLDKATDVEDILRVYDSLSRVRSEIEQIKGRMQYLERTSSMSLITVYLEPEVSGKPLARAGWSAMEVLKSAIRGLVNAGQILATVAIWLIFFIPIWGIILGIILWLRHRKKRA